jgi:hypothetical protein
MHFCLRCDEYLPSQALTKQGDPRDPDYFCKSWRKCNERKERNGEGDQS